MCTPTDVSELVNLDQCISLGCNDTSMYQCIDLYPTIKLHQQLNGKSSFLCDYQSKIIFQSKNGLHRYTSNAVYVNVFFELIMVNSCKGYSSSFSDILLMWIVL